jgi:hypothetical protein
MELSKTRDGKVSCQRCGTAFRVEDSAGEYLEKLAGKLLAKSAPAQPVRRQRPTGDPFSCPFCGESVAREIFPGHVNRCADRYVNVVKAASEDVDGPAVDGEAAEGPESPASAARQRLPAGPEGSRGLGCWVATAVLAAALLTPVVWYALKGRGHKPEEPTAVLGAIAARGEKEMVEGGLPVSDIQCNVEKEEAGPATYVGQITYHSQDLGFPALLKEAHGELDCRITYGYEGKWRIKLVEIKPAGKEEWTPVETAYWWPAVAHFLP